jgi:hypothetical protein
LSNAGVTSGQSTAVQYAELPANVLASRDATIEVWYTAPNSANWSRVFDFGSQSGMAGDSYLMFTPRSSADSRAVLRPSGGTERVATGPTIVDSNQRMAAVVVDSIAGLLRLYIDGAASGTALLNRTTAGSVNDTLAYLGRSLFAADAGFSGSINELRIYDDAVTASQVQVHAAMGPSTSRLGADYDGDYDVDGSDFLSWQRTVGSTTTR